MPFPKNGFSNLILRLSCEGHGGELQVLHGIRFQEDGRVHEERGNRCNVNDDNHFPLFFVGKHLGDDFRIFLDPKSGPTKAFYKPKRSQNDVQTASGRLDFILVPFWLVKRLSRARFGSKKYEKIVAQTVSDKIFISMWLSLLTLRLLKGV